MKITRRQLRQIIKEELKIVLSEIAVNTGQQQRAGSSSSGVPKTTTAYPGGIGIGAKVSCSDVTEQLRAEMSSVESQIAAASQQDKPALQAQYKDLTSQHRLAAMGHGCTQ